MDENRRSKTQMWHSVRILFVKESENLHIPSMKYGMLFYETWPTKKIQYQGTNKKVETKKKKSSRGSANNFSKIVLNESMVQYRGMDDYITTKLRPCLCSCTYSIPLGALPVSCLSACIFAPHQYRYIYWVWQLTDSAILRRALELPHLCGQPCIWWRYTSVNTSISYRDLKYFFSLQLFLETSFS